MSRADDHDSAIVESPGSPPTPEPVTIPRSAHDDVIRVGEAQRRSLRRWAIAAGIVLAIAVLAVSLTATPLFHAKTIEVEGAHRLSDRQVRKAAGVDANTNVFSLDEGTVERRLERDPWIADAVVVTSLPSTVRISVSERIPVGLTRTQDGAMLVAGDGSILGPSSGGTLPEIRMPTPAIGQPVAPVPTPLLTTAASAAAEFGPALRPQIAAIIAQPDGTLTLELGDGVTVAFGGPNDLEAKAEALRAIVDYADAEGEDLISIDVRSPAAPTAVFVGSAVSFQVPTDGDTARRHDKDDSPREPSSPKPSP
ncbi:MAG TPA: FtsQ-type POTRA domain-containing protein [Actinomycetota bacterium]